MLQARLPHARRAARVAKPLHEMRGSIRHTVALYNREADFNAIAQERCRADAPDCTKRDAASAAMSYEKGGNIIWCKAAEQIDV